MKDKVVLDTNCLIASLSKRGAYFNVWSGLLAGEFTLCVSNDILLEYEEVLGIKVNQVVAFNVLRTLRNSPYVEFVIPHFFFGLIKSDPDDNKFVDCAIAAGATFVVSNDTHFNVLHNIPFPHVHVIDIATFSRRIGNAGK